MFLLVAGYPDFLHHQVLTSPLWGLRLPSLGSGGRLGHCSGLHHLDSFGCCSHIVGATWLIHAGDVYLLFFHPRCCSWYPRHDHRKSSCVLIFLLQKLKLSITPHALNEMSKMPYYERGGRDGYPVIAVISSNIRLPEKPPVQTNFWYLIIKFTWPPRVADFFSDRVNHKLLFTTSFKWLWKCVAAYLPCRYIRLAICVSLLI